VKKNKKIVLENVLVEAYAAEGKCLAHVDGKVIFIDKAVPGDVVDLRILKSKKDWAEGHPINYVSLAANRIEPFCSHFGVCGGCKWQMLPYQQQLVYKQQQVADQLRRIGGIMLPTIHPIVGGEIQRFYRNKLEYTFCNKKYLTSEEVKQEEVSQYEDVAGFHAPQIFDKVVNIDTCFLQVEPTNIIRNTVKDFALKNKYTFYDIRMHTGWLRTMQVRICTTGQIMVNIVVAHEQDKWLKALLNHLMEQVPTITTLLYTINQKWNDSLYDQTPITWHGPGFVIEKLEQYQFKIGPTSFFQTNTKQAEKLYQLTREYAELDGSQIVYDLYCGTGSIGLFVSHLAKKIIGVELVPAAIADAKENAALNQVNHAHFFAGDVADICTPQFFETHGRPDVIITDPPRAGMHEKLVKQILAMDAPLVVYVSCNPATQARDLKLLNEKYEVTKVQPVDMFPHTHHIENIVQLKKRSNATT
jgi:23S rRNA (uracil1939-C5)-methyltransferase